MSQLPLHTYLKDHLAGSVAALELLDHLRGGAAPMEARQFLTTLRDQIEEEQQVLQSLLRDLGGTESRLREAGAWVGEKLSELKLKVEDPSGTGLRYFEALEALTLGIRGKLALWTALQAVRDRVPQLGAVDLARFIERSRDQHAQVETRRVAAAREALATA
ncbi:MAG TPA: hypothetical protein VIG08_08945 [Gemmatimonadales bacterium]